jgi:hypothetical protein
MTPSFPSSTMNPNAAWFSLTNEDIQIIAQEKIGRSLTDDELTSVINMAGHGIEWFNPIRIAIGML